MSASEDEPKDPLVDLVERFRRGDREAFRRLYLALYDPVARFVARRVASREDAEDLVSRVFFKLLSRLDDYDARRGTVVVFVIRIARNAVIDHVRTKFVAIPIDDVGGLLADETGTPLDALVEEEELRELRALVQELPAETREMLALRYGDGLKHAEIAGVLGLEVDAVKQRFSRALAALRAAMLDARSRRDGDGLRAAKGAVFDA